MSVSLPYVVNECSAVDARSRLPRSLIPLSEAVTRISKQPLAHQPERTFEYSLSTDVLGRLIEVVSGKPLDEVVESVTAHQARSP